MTDHTVPPIGMRMIKTAAAVLICLLVSMAVDREDMRIYSSIAALLCVQPYAEDTKRMAIQRIVGTAIGSVFGIATLLLEMALDIQGTLVGYIVIAAVTVPNLWIAVVLKSSNAAALSGIVFLSITVTHVTDASPWIFAWYRASETLVGIAVGIAVNAFQLPRRKRRDVLFVSGLDGLLLTEQGTLTPGTCGSACPSSSWTARRCTTWRRSGISMPASCPGSWPCGARRCSGPRASTAFSTVYWMIT